MENKQRILVTGASSGLGKDFAVQLAKEGYTVYAAARRLDRLKELEQFGIHPLQMDVTKEADVVKAVERIEKEIGGIDVLINNAGYAIYGAVETIPLEDARRQFDVNIFGLARLTQLVLPGMREQKRGKIINISSMGGKVYTPLGAWYHATKHALEGWSDCLRLELEQFDIDVVIIEPGLIETEFTDVVGESLFKRDQGSAYRPMVEKLAGAQKNLSGSHPSVITNLILKAVKAKKPKTRYKAGKMAKPVMFMRWLLSDRMFDKIIMSQMK